MIIHNNSVNMIPHNTNANMVAGHKEVDGHLHDNT